MEQIKDTLAKIMRDWQARRDGEAGDDPEAILKKILTKNEIRHIKLKYFKQGAATFIVDSSSWLYYFTLKKADLLAALQKESVKIKSIRLYLGEMS